MGKPDDSEPNPNPNPNSTPTPTPNEVGKLEEGEAEEGWFFLFFLYIVAVSFFLINMFTGILYQQFSKIRNELNASQFLTSDQRNWVALPNSNPSPSLNPSLSSQPEPQP